MARKSLTDIDPQLKSVLEEFQAVSLVKHEMFEDAYKLQDTQTKRVIDRIVGVLQTYATGHITATVNNTVYPIKIGNEYLGYNLAWLALEVVKDLAICDIRVASFKFPESLCIKCGDVVIPERKKGKVTR